MASQPRRRARKPTQRENEGDGPGTLGEFLAFLIPGTPVQRLPPPAWPPDMFAVVGSVLERSEAYLAVLVDWPPGQSRSRRDPARWTREMRRIGDQWRRTCFHNQVPAKVRDWWRTVRRGRGIGISELRGERALSEALLQLAAAADEASAGVGFPGSGSLGGQRDPDQLADELFRQEALRLLVSSSIGAPGSTLCQEIEPSKVRVLPKLHTPQSGATMRSLSHHLALYSSPAVTPKWYSISPRRNRSEPGGRKARWKEPHCLNLLLLPWPERLIPSQFQAVEPEDYQLLNLNPEVFGFFRFCPQRAESPALLGERVERIVGEAERMTGPIDGVLLPELALTRDEREVLSPWLTDRGKFLIAGLCDPDRQNFLAIDLVTEVKPGYQAATTIEQHKHHRWQLDRRQIVQYGLGGSLDPSKRWWEDIALDRRELGFVTLHSWLTFCVLICEDLARQDPAADLLRRVGPNLVIALLMDGPQLAQRWPARYATVLADDPGSSVLTVTSVGMAELSRPSGKPVSRVVALWKDARLGETTEITLPPGADGLVLHLAREWAEELSADGRGDQGSTGYVTLSGVHSITAPKPVSPRAASP